ncbi:NAD(P)/FAD-dependent oxidoreductase [Vitiosangium sp. GDMCC 1.1324]|uniref:FAD-dependent oxidoreductase n=1 Tax=Vitiosangium sp. (strain GDMCC 1.1324) TaxID=2138576 RepID=UPI000D3A7785|nr:FAD-dependent monooxygenase [Vitiosangium sp. GDMCC 1.1324]PTL76442.1 hypothetical protein DAT35_49850 [Vitiosangium sp. GDMCC 1.1324]
MTVRYKHAVVIGGSMAGLLAARVLADHAAQVTLVERDLLPDGPEDRKGVPQARHVHVLLTRGAQALDELFPGFLADVEAAGATRLDQTRDFRTLQFGFWKPRYESGSPMFCMSRPFVEHHVRERVRRLPNVRVLEQASVEGLVSSPDHAYVRGVRVQRGGQEEQLEADLVVDASGRGTRAPKWLESLGYGAPEVSTLQVDLAYASRAYRMPAEPPDWKALTVTTAPPLLRNGVVTPIEGGRWMVTLWGYFGDHPQADPEGFDAFARSLPVPDMADALQHAEPLTQVSVFKYAGYLRRHYERMPRFPEGYVVLGDAACSFNPIYGQGMTTAALEALELRACLREGDGQGLSRRFQKRLSKVVDTPWQLATSGDLGYPQVEGNRPAAMLWAGKYVQRLLAVARHDPEVDRVFLEVKDMVKPPSALFAPWILWRVLTSRPSAPEASASPSSGDPKRKAA